MTFQEAVKWCEEKSGVNVAFHMRGSINTHWILFAGGLAMAVEPCNIYGWAHLNPPTSDEEFKGLTIPRFKSMGRESYQHGQAWDYLDIMTIHWQKFESWEQWMKYRDDKTRPDRYDRQEI